MPEPEATALARDWLGYAEADLRAAAGALRRRSDFAPRHACFSAQQAAEKAIKACCVLEQIEPRFSHDLVVLARQLPASMPLRTGVEDLGWLVQWATSQRYPGGDEPEWSDAARAVEIAETLVADVRTNLAAA